jgi:hypothetical protein
MSSSRDSRAEAESKHFCAEEEVVGHAKKGENLSSTARNVQGMLTEEQKVRKRERITTNNFERNSGWYTIHMVVWVF